VALEGPDLAWKLGQLLRWLDDQYMVDPFDAIAWERPLLTPTDTVDLLELLYGCAGVCYAFAGKHKLPWREVSVEDVKKGLTGKPRAKKEEMLYAAKRVLNWPWPIITRPMLGAVGVIAYARLWPKRVAA